MNAKNKKHQDFIPNSRDEIAIAVLQGLYSNIRDARALVIGLYGETIPLAEALTRIAYEQADEVIRLRSL